MLVFSSSHSSVLAWIPSPQVDVQSPCPSQVKPVSISQVSLQPSPDSWFPSSHSSSSVMFESPQYAVAPFIRRQSAAQTWHSSSPYIQVSVTLLPSSHPSLLATTSSPQLDRQTPSSQVKPTSISHRLLHPSPGNWLPSSQTSSSVMFESPQYAVAPFTNVQSAAQTWHCCSP